MSFVLLLILLAFDITGQSVRPTAEERMAQITKRLKAERAKIDCKKNDGECGMVDYFLAQIKPPTTEGKRHVWMEKMQELGIRQASFEFDATCKNDGLKLKFTRIVYYQEYYISKSIVQDSKLLSQIKKSTLENDLKAAVEIHFKKQHGTCQQTKRWEDNLTLFDDEAIPPIQWIY